MEIERIRTFVQNGRSFIEYRCDVCNCVGVMSQSHFNEGTGCSVCSGKTVVKGINDIATILPEIAQLIIPQADTFLYTSQSSKKVTAACPVCGFQKSVKISQLSRRGFKCPVCHGGYSMPNRFMAALLSQCGVEFNSEKTFSWSKRYRYDFYLPQHNLIVELNGAQHYKEVPMWTDYEVVKRSDAEKFRLAKENSISNYVVIPLEKSDIHYMKNQIYSSELFDLIGIERDKISMSLVYGALNTGVAAKCLELWKRGVKDIRKISEDVKICTSSVSGYLKQYAEIGLCDYSPDEQRRKNQERAALQRKRRVICNNTGVVYNSIREAAKANRLNENAIQNCVSGRSGYSGKDNDGNKLSWSYI